MEANTAVGLLFISIAIFGSVSVYSDAKSDQVAMQSGLQQCVVKFDGGVTKAWQKECSK
mgnify:FL=1